jgi:hypothetical protein
MKFPIIAFTRKDEKMWSMNNKFFIADKRKLQKKNICNSNIQVVDSDGQLYYIKFLEQDGNLLFIESIKKLGLMVKVKPTFEKNSENIILEDLKIRIKRHTEKTKVFGRL